MRDIHRGSPNERVKIKWLVILRQYGVNPSILKVRIKINKGVIISDDDFMLYIMDRESWVLIVDIISDEMIEIGDPINQ